MHRLIIIGLLGLSFVTNGALQHGNTEPKLRATSVENQIIFTLYTRNNRQGTVLTFTGQVYIDFNKYTPCITHGWNNNLTSEPNIVQIKDAYLAKYDCNVIIVDWTRLAGNLNETIGVTNSVPVGEYYGRFLNNLVSKGANPSRFHLVGHTLGAHVSGLAAYAVYVAWNAKVLRVTGLDASKRYNNRRLQKSDATYVDVIHTSIGYYGITDAIGLADFYPNNGVVPQPGCGGFHEYLIACSSFKSIDFFVQSIYKENKYVATRCASYGDYKSGKCANGHISNMGEDLSPNANGLYYLSTY